MKNKIIAHSDLNCYYASVEMLRNPRLREVPMAVCGSREERHGIVLAANYPAKRKGVKTGMANWEAHRLCPGMYSVPPNFDSYLQFSRFTRELYSFYTDRIEPFGLDECWLDFTGCVPEFSDGERLIYEIKDRIKRELGLTVSIGLSDNKIFAKLGSDMRKPDACMVIPRESYKEIVWPVPVGELLYVGRATESKLKSRFIYTIGDLANADPDNMRRWFGKVGLVLHAFANGEDQSMVAPTDYESPIKSVGNSFTCPRDLCNDADARIMIYALSESVGARLMEYGYYATTVELSFVNKDLTACWTRQRKLPVPTNISGEIAFYAISLFRKVYGHWPAPLRKIGVRGVGLVSDATPRQITVFENADKMIKRENLEYAINVLRSRYGNKCIQRAIMYTDGVLSGVDPKKDHVIHPVGVFTGGMTVSWGGYTTSIMRSAT